MKKIIFIGVFLAFLTTGVFAQVSIGGGAFFDWSFNNGIKDGDDYMGMRNMSFGGYIFFDAAYLEADISFAYGMVSSVIKGGGLPLSGDAGSMLQLGFSLLAKYPIKLESVTIFPLIGAGYNMVLSYKVNGVSAEDAREYLSQFGLLAGVGLDFNLTNSLFLRAETLFQARFPMKLMKETADAVDMTAALGMGPVIKVGIGYRF